MFVIMYSVLLLCFQVNRWAHHGDW